ncbi:MAG: Ig-like domain-containing protein, partial [Gemmatimonadetes bacterium]|nr:Ig-like domain-containing protein [Gemmatimonadota bacterium]
MVASPPVRRLALFVGLLTAVLISCGREITGPGSVTVNAFKRVAAFSFSPQYETAVPSSALHAALTQVAFERVRITLRREDGTIALDTVVDFPAGADSLTLSLVVPLAANAPASGVPLSLNLGYVNAAGDTVFKGGPFPVTVTPSTGGAPPPPVQVPVHYTGTGASAASVVISPKTVNGTAGQTTTFSAQALASNGQVIAGTPVVFTSSNAGVVRVNATTGAADLLGRGTARVYAQLLTGLIDSATVSVILPAARLELVSGSAQTAPASTTLPQPVIARVLASDGVAVSGVTVTFAVTSGGGSVTPATAVSAADGSVSASWKLGSTVGAQALSVSAAGLTGSPLAVSATALAVTPTKLTVTAQPTGAKTGTSLGTATVAAQTADGVTVSVFTGDVSVSLGTNPGGATLSGTTTVTAVNGVATFTGLTLNKPASGYTLVFSSSGLTSATSSAFDVTVGATARLIVGSVPAYATAGGLVTPAITVTAVDSDGNTVPTFTGAVTMALGTNPKGGTLTGTLTRNAVAGVATFDDLSINRAAAGYTLSATSSALTAGSSAAFNVTADAPAELQVVRGDAQTRPAGSTLDTIVVRVVDALGNGVGANTVAFAVAGGGGSVVTVVSTTNGDGEARALWTIGAGAQTLTVTSGALSPITLTATGSTTYQLVVTTAPGTTQTAGVVLTPGALVAYKNAAGVLQTGFTGAVTASVLSGPAGAALLGTTTVNAVNGVASFSALRLNKAGTYSLQFTTSGASNGNTGSFSVLAAAAKTIAADSGQAQTGTAGATLAQPLVVLVTDSLGNPIAGRSITWAVGSGGGSVDSTTTVTNAAGRTRVRFTPGVGANSATATSAGLTGSPVTFTATGTVSSAVVSTLVSPHVDTIVSLNATFALAAQARDAAVSPVAGHFTWVSRTPAVAAVDTSGVVKAIANGTAWVIATETGGTKDSALIVVQQRVATITVTPGTRNIYRTRNYAFTATAVDGMGNVMPGITAFTWSSVTPSVATVDTAGKVTAVALGSTQVRAVNGAITGVTTVTVLTPITRIIVGRDSLGVPVTDTTSLTSLGIGRFFRAEARDTLDAVMTGVTFAWSSDNGSVAMMDSITATRARALSNANGSTRIFATAEGVNTYFAPLKVQQVLAAIELTPTPDTIGVTGTVQLTARGKDANGRGISGGSFTYASSNVAIATVNATTGVVAGVTLGTANVTAASGAITSNNAVIEVSTTVPPRISFGRDTLTVGRGASTSIPIFLSRPNASAVTVNLAARDTNAYFSVASVSIPSGTTAVNVTLNGRNAGTTQIYATDGGGGGFSGDTAAVAVQANMRIAQTSWSLNATDQVASQVLLSDPSPAGGTFVTFTYGTAGRAQVSPDPAFIPQGQLASNIVITALGLTSGSTTITPVATGVNGTASTLNISAPVLTISAGAAATLGAGQFEGNWYVYTPQYVSVALPLTYTSSDTSKVTVAPLAGSIPGGLYYQYFTVSGKAPGTASVIVSAPGWKPDTLFMTISSPRTMISGTTSLNTTSPVTSLTVYATDSAGTARNRTSSLALTISSSDTSVIQIIDKTPTIAAGLYYAGGIRYQPGGAGGTAYVKVVAGGHRPDSMLVTVVGPKLQFSWNANQVGTGQYEPNVYVYTPNNVVNPLTVTLANSGSTKATIPASVTVTAGSSYVYFNVSGLDTGVVTFIATAPGYQPDTATYRISSPRVSVTLSGGGTFNNFRAPTGFTVYSTDSAGTAHYRTAPLAFTLRSTNTAVLTVDSATATIAAGLYYHNTARVSFIGIGTAYLVAEAPGHRPDSVLYTVQTPKLNFSFTSGLLGRRQSTTATDYYVYTPDSRAGSVPVTITQTRPSSDSLTATALTIPAASYYAYFGAFGLTPGVDTLIASASGYLPDTAFIRVGPQRLTVSGLPGTALTTSPSGSVTVYATDSVGNAHYSMDTVVVRVTSSDTTVIKPTLAYVRIPKGLYYISAGYSYFGPGTASLTFTDSAGSGYGSVTTNSVTVTGPSLIFSNTNAMYGMRQRGGTSDYYVYTQNNVASNTTVNLVSTDTRVATVPASVTIPAGSYYAYFTITAQDTVGTIQVQATAVGFGPPTPINVQVTQPKFTYSINTSARTTQGPQTITVYAADANGTAHYATENVTVDLASSSGAVASLDSSTVTILAGNYYHNTSHWLPVSVGSAQISATDARAAIYKYNPATANVAVTTPSLSFSWNV